MNKLLLGATLALVLPCAGLVAAAQQSLSNDAVIRMVKAGLGDEVIVVMIAGQPGNYSVTPDTLIEMKQQGISDRVVGAMVARATGLSVATSAGIAPTAAITPVRFEQFDIGVYQKKADWEFVQSEAVNWKTGGVLKSLATNGIVKKDINGHINGSTSHTSLTTATELLIKTSDGVEATDFQLVRLHENGKSREFRTVTGGVFHASGGAQRDSVSFEQKMIGRHAYAISFSGPLKPGEYAFSRPGIVHIYSERLDGQSIHLPSCRVGELDTGWRARGSCPPSARERLPGS